MSNGSIEPDARDPLPLKGQALLDGADRLLTADDIIHGNSADHVGEADARDREAVGSVAPGWPGKETRLVDIGRRGGVRYPYPGESRQEAWRCPFAAGAGPHAAQQLAGRMALARRGLRIRTIRVVTAN